MFEMIERVARAIHKAIDEDTWVGEFAPGEVVVDGNVDFMALARAAIEAMREPEDMMFMKGGNTPPSNQGRDHLGKARSMKRIGDLAAKECWETMVDAALKS